MRVQDSESAVQAGISRRRTARIEQTGQVSVGITDAAFSTDLRDLSLGGFSIVSTKNFPLGMTHWFRFTTTGGEVVTLPAKAVHCRPLPGDTKYISGWEFMPGSAEVTDIAVGRLLDAMTNVLSVD